MYYCSGHAPHQQTVPPDADQFLQFPLAVFTLFEDLHLLVLHQIVKQGINQRDEPDTLFVHRQGTGDNNFVFIHQLLLQASQGDRFATCHLPPRHRLLSVVLRVSPLHIMLHHFNRRGLSLLSVTKIVSDAGEYFTTV